MSATGDRWARVNELFHEALARTPSERDAYLASLGERDLTLRAEVKSLLAAHRADDAFLLGDGSRFGDYEVTGFIASGGMGDVYRARDTRLGRDAALKVLPAAFVADPDRRARFEREARTLASLTHPHVGAIYGFEEQGSMAALALELVNGETLVDRIARGRLPVDEALRVASQVADALEAAHARGIVHRDLKPGNITFTRDGVVKVLDFGLAKLVESGDAGTVSLAPTVSFRTTHTGAGVIVGTPAYMSPEQARGEEADQRSDVWAFGCVLYEMLTARPAFSGSTVADTIASVLAAQPDFDALPKNLSPTVRSMIVRCLSKDRAQRIPHASVVRFLLNEPTATSEPLETSRAWTFSLPQNRMSRAVVILVIISLAGTARVVLRSRPSAPPPSRVSRLVIAPSGTAALSFNGNVRDIAITPDGSRVVYAGNNGTELFVRALDSLEAVSIYKGTPRGPFISPDGQWVGFFDDFNTLKKVAITGGPAITLTKIDGGASRGAVWMPDDTIVFASNTVETGLQRIAAGGGASTVLTKPDRAHGEADHILPELLPGGRGVLFTIIAQTGGLDTAQVALLDLRTAARKILVRGGSDAHYVPSGHLVYAAEGALRAVSFDLAKLETVGNSVAAIPTVLTNVRGGMDAVVAQDGTLAYLPGSVLSSAQLTLVWVGRDGKETAIPAPPRNYVYPRLSPDGTRIAEWMPGDGLGAIWIWDLMRLTLMRATFGPLQASFPVWTRDGRRIIFSSRTSASSAAYLFWQAADGTGHAEPLSDGGPAQNPTAVTPDGTQLIFTEGRAANGANDVMQLQLAGAHQVTPLIQTPFTEQNGIVSPDSRWLAYEANDSGEFEIYVRPYPDVNSGHWQVSTGGGTRPLWSHSGRELFYIKPDGALMRVGVETGATWAATTPALLIAPGLNYLNSGPSIAGRTYDISSDDQRFLLIKNAPSATQEAATRQIIVVQHFDEELKRLLPPN